MNSRIRIGGLVLWAEFLGADKAWMCIHALLGNFKLAGKYYGRALESYDALEDHKRRILCDLNAHAADAK